MILLAISFIAGVLTVLAPCILPLLPVIIGGSVAFDGTKGTNYRKIFTIIISLCFSLAIFTLLLKATTLFIMVPEIFWTILSGGIIVILGFITIFPSVWANRYTAKLSRESNMMLGAGNMRGDFWGNVLVGGALGPVFSSCSPTYFIVVATILPVSFALGLVYMLAYIVGLALALLVISLVGQRIVDRLGWATSEKGVFKRILGLIFVVVGVLILFGADKKIQLYILERGFFDVTRIEQNLLRLRADTEEFAGTNEYGVDNQTVDTTREVVVAPEVSVSEDKSVVEKVRTNPAITTRPLKNYKKAPELSSIDGYINTDGQEIRLADYHGKKVVLLDIWTYSCINCQRTLPYLNQWYEKYKDEGLEIVGLHTPEFAFEHKIENVRRAVQEAKIKYPVVLDNDYSTWNALGNQYWPRKYLIDLDGNIIYDHIGEGDYEETERAIQQALKVVKTMSQPSDAVTVDRRGVGSPETYFGSLRNRSLAEGPADATGWRDFTPPKTFGFNELYLAGKWKIEGEYAESGGDGSIFFRYQAKNVYLVASSAGKQMVEIHIDGKLKQTLEIGPETLYDIELGADYGEHLLEIRTKTPGLRAFAFTFG